MRYGNNVYWAMLPNGITNERIEVRQKNGVICLASTIPDAVNIIDALMFLYRIQNTKNAYITDAYPEKD